jgi:hypothetical protein
MSDTKSKYTVESASKRITANGGKIGGKVIEIEKPGLKILGAISYLVNKHGYHWAEHQFGPM